MKKIAIGLFAMAIWAAPAAAATVAHRAEPTVFAGGGTQLSNGLFFPGTVLCAGSGNCTGVPYEIPRGSDLRFVNLDSGTIANGHGIVSKDRKKRTGRPLFKSKVLRDPGETVVITSKLKPGVYEYSCPVHAGMDGVLEVVE